MSDAVGRTWHLYIGDMLTFCERLLSYVDGLTKEHFLADGLTYDATLRNLEMIGEAATHIPDEVRGRHPEIPWRLIIATRNRLIHGYLGIDEDTVWSLVSVDVPELVEKLRRLLGEQA